MTRNNEIIRTIPPGREVRIIPGAMNDETAEPIGRLMLKDSFTVPISAEYTSINNSASFLQSVGSQILKGISEGLSSIVGGLNTKLGFQTYSSPKPITINLNCSLMAVTDAWEEVVNPVRKIQSLLVPREGDLGFLTDYPGVDPMIVLSGNRSNHSYKDAHVFVGNIGFNHVIFKNADASFSSEVDQTGYPISAELSLTFDTSFFATTQMLNEEVYGCNSKGIPLRTSEYESSSTLAERGLKNPWE